MNPLANLTLPGKSAEIDQLDISVADILTIFKSLGYSSTMMETVMRNPDLPDLAYKLEDWPSTTWLMTMDYQLFITSWGFSGGCLCI